MASTCSGSMRWARMLSWCRTLAWRCWHAGWCRTGPACLHPDDHSQPGGRPWAAQAGFKRVVLAREVGLDEIKEMGPDAVAQGIGLEVFVHGALCYSYSGQCLLSSAIGGRSGNRGMCAQPCRKPYVLLRGKKDEFGRPAGPGGPAAQGEISHLHPRPMHLQASG